MRKLGPSIRTEKAGLGGREVLADFREGLGRIRSQVRFCVLPVYKLNLFLRSNVLLRSSQMNPAHASLASAEEYNWQLIFIIH